MDRLTAKTPDKEPQYMKATGKLPHPLINDYMFKALLQKNENVLKHLICSLLHLRPERVERADLKNPIILGKALTEDFDSKTFALDINVLLDDRVLINLEMQIVDYKNWPERSLTYLCRNFDQLARGVDYIEIRPTIHIGFLDFTLFPEHPEFYATYKMANIKNHHIFTDKFALSVVNLKHIELATQEDREWEIDYWASLFKATTWEELKMLAQQNPILEEAVETIYELTADESIREQCKAREKHIREMNTIVREREMAINAKDKAAQERDTAIQQKDAAVLERDTAVLERDTVLREKDDYARQLEQQAKQIEQLLLENSRLKQQQSSDYQ